MEREEYEIPPCKICSCVDEDEDDYGCEAKGFDCYEEIGESYCQLQTWVKPLIEESFHHCHARDTYHICGKLDSKHEKFSNFWEKFTRAKKDGNQPIKCPQCQCEDLRNSSQVFRRGDFEPQSFKCYVCFKGCISCYVIPLVHESTKKKLGNSFAKELRIISRLDFSDEKKRKAKAIERNPETKSIILSMEK